MLTKKIKDQDIKASQAFLYWKIGNQLEQREVDHFLSIGRESHNKLVLDDNYVSRSHARIEKKSEKNIYLLRDLNSQNGIFLNGSRVHEAILNHNDSIQIGKTQFTFSFERYNHKWKLIHQSLNKKWNETLSRIPYLAQSEAPALILGPSGSGKEIIAQMIHKHSKRAQNSMVSINCSALTENLIESELFGHKRGSYTGSVDNRKGAFVTAKNGTLFMDEIGDLPYHLQPKLLRAIEYKEVKPLGSDLPLKVDARVISATHQNLKTKAEQNEFRKDLYFRLNVITIHVPPLRERMEDFENLFKYFCLIYGVTFSSKALSFLKGYHWPGNIRELKNTVERAKAIFQSEVLDKQKAVSILDIMEAENKTKEESLSTLEKKIITKALKLFKGNQAKVSNYLDIPRSSLHDKVIQYKINLLGFKKKKKAKKITKEAPLDKPDEPPKNIEGLKTTPEKLESLKDEAKNTPNS